MKHLKTYEAFSIGEEKYVILTKDEKMFAAWNKYNDRLELFPVELFNKLSTDRYETFFDMENHAKNIIENADVEGVIWINDYQNKRSFVKQQIYKRPDWEHIMGNVSYAEDVESGKLKLIFQKEFDEYLNNLKIEKAFLGIQVGDTDIDL